MKIKSNFVLQQVADNWVAVTTGQGIVDFDGMVSFNETALFLWKQLMKEQTEESLVKNLMAEYDIDKTTAQNGVRSFIEQLQNHHLLDQDLPADAESE